VGSAGRSLSTTQPAHAADRLPCRWWKGSALGSCLKVEYTGRRLHSCLSSFGLFRCVSPASSSRASRRTADAQAVRRPSVSHRCARGPYNTYWRCFLSPGSPSEVNWSTLSVLAHPHLVMRQNTHQRNHSLRACQTLQPITFNRSATLSSLRRLGGAARGRQPAARPVGSGRRSEVPRRLDAAPRAVTHQLPTSAPHPRQAGAGLVRSLARSGHGAPASRFGSASPLDSLADELHKRGTRR
jgi:hypothetical protein